MEPCEYPNCRLPGTLVPVIALPTLRTVALPVPVDPHPQIGDDRFMASIGLNSNIAIAQHERVVREYREQSSELIQTDEPTYLIGVPLCQQHAATYNLLNWMDPSDWKAIQEAGMAKGFHVPEPAMVVIQFKPVGWDPKRGYMEVTR